MISKHLLVALLLLGGGCGDRQPAAQTHSDPPQVFGARLQQVMTPPASEAQRAAADPTTTDPDKYSAVMDNRRVRVLRYHDEPGARTRQHRHPDSVLHALSTFRRRLRFPDGSVQERQFKAGDVMWIPAQTHIGENIGATPTEVLLIEVK